MSHEYESASTARAQTWLWPRLRPRPVATILVAVLLLGMFQGLTVLLSMRADNDLTPWTRPFSWEITGALAGAICGLVPVTVVLNAGRAHGRWRRLVAMHLIGYLAYTLPKTPLMLGLRSLLYPLLGWGRYRYSYWAGHLAMESMKDVVSYAVIVTAFSLYRTARERQEQALRAAELAGELKATRLQALLGQLNPHFLMNALNTISSVMFEDVARTDRLLSDLGLVLRAGFETERPTWSLAEEQAHTARFVAILEARFADRLRVEWLIPARLARIEVPRFALQILVENAVKHNQDRPALLALRIAARRDGDSLTLEVADSGRGFGAPSPARGAGLGLRHLEEVLRLLHGPRAGLERGAGADGGACVRMTLPAEAE